MIEMVLQGLRREGWIRLSGNQVIRLQGIRITGYQSEQFKGAMYGDL